MLHTKTAITTPSQHRTGLRVIAVYEIIKTTCLVLVAIAAFHLEHQQNFDRLVYWLGHLTLTDSNELRWRLVDALQNFGPSRFVAVGLVALVYAVLFGIEGVGLLMGKYWAEWFTVIATGSLIPLELYETVRHFGWVKFATLVGNVVIVVYLVRVALHTREMRKVAPGRPLEPVRSHTS
ncbi:DUF2127 domain-containing protein [Rhodanobacter sp. 7MK24]|uniref:DUF2127 domain-containing protein n=1 Tax=Rhodanobacter sp. 7MK24 TaxID=2775922 RepID=UPI00177ADAC5|nr:DUF2127 domain-containing protein [Rhodanobacter sp. 7MK24]MBD8879032.1 DUF2127 domain-containing protein [Rhodanobacter sp. 7MK24]